MTLIRPESAGVYPDPATLDFNRDQRRMWFEKGIIYNSTQEM